MEKTEQEKGAAEHEMIGWRHQLNGHEFEQTPGDSGQGSLMCCSPCGRKESHDLVTEQQEQLAPGGLMMCSRHLLCSPQWLLVSNSFFCVRIAHRERNIHEHPS